MMTESRRFRFNRPQQLAALLLLLFVVQGLWGALRRPLSAAGQAAVACGQVPWRVGAAQGVCQDAGEGLLAVRLASLSVGLGMRVVGDSDLLLRLLARLPFLFTAVVLGGGLWWVTRRQFGNLGGYTALGFYCVSPLVVRAGSSVNGEILAALAVYGGVYTCIGVAHAMQGPRRKWKPRIVLLTVILTVAALAHWAALAATFVVGLGLMLWIAEGRRKLLLPVVAIAMIVATALGAVFAGLPPVELAAKADLPQLAELTEQIRQSATVWLTGHGALLLALAGALALYGASRRSRYFGNSAPLIAALAMLGIGTALQVDTPELWALPFGLTFLSGLAADGYESARGAAVRWGMTALVAAQAVVCWVELAG